MEMSNYYAVFTANCIHIHCATYRVSHTHSTDIKYKFLSNEMFSLTLKTFPNINKLSKIHSLNGIGAIRNCSVVDKTPIEEEDGMIIYCTA